MATSIRGGGGMVPADNFVSTVAIVTGLYGATVFLLPQLFHDMHFHSPDMTAQEQYWLRGMSVPLVMASWAMMQLDTSVAHAPVVLYAIAIALAYPWNAKLGYLLKNKLDCKYPTHAVPEIMLASLAIAGLLSLL
jgi:hypothetical protein